MSWRDDPATITQKLALRNALDRRYGMGEGRKAYEALEEEGLTKGRASDELNRLYHKEEK